MLIKPGIVSILYKKTVLIDLKVYLNEQILSKFHIIITYIFLNQSLDIEGDIIEEKFF